MTTFVDQMGALAAAITAAGDAYATTSLEEAAANLPCLYVTPPTLDYAASTLAGLPVVRHTIAALSSRSAEDVEALDELVGLIDLALTALPTIERAEPAAYALTADRTVPAYLLTLTR